MLKNKTLLGESYGWSKTRLISLCFLFYPCISIANEADTSSFYNPKYILPALVAIFVALLAHVIIPEINNYRNKRKSRRSYLAYIKSSLESSMSDFEGEMSISMAKQLMNADPFWLETLSEANLGVPEIFVNAHSAFNKILEQDHSLEDKYIAYFYYEGFYSGDLDHEHPLWELGAKDTKIISDYLLSQSQVENSSKRLYSEDYKKMLNSKKKERVQQWIKASNRVLNELALHYININKLKAYLKAK